jgi:2-hydroxy-3-keto-5-methylthiopentenyl-1-phosphate phosphatase
MVELVSRLVRKDIPVIIASEGLDVYIRPLLGKAGLSAVSLVCNRIEMADALPVIAPALAADVDPCARCLSCKGALARQLKQRTPGMRIALVGNGASDLCGAREADAVFARDSLARHCSEEKIPYVPWSSARDITSAEVWADIWGTRTDR